MKRYTEADLRAQRRESELARVRAIQDLRQGSRTSRIGGRPNRAADKRSWKRELQDA